MFETNCFDKNRQNIFYLQIFKQFIASYLLTLSVQARVMFNESPTGKKRN